MTNPFFFSARCGQLAILLFAIAAFLGLGCDQSTETAVETGTIEITSNVRGTTFTLDGKRVTENRVQVPAGRHMIEASFLGHRTVRRSAQVMANDKVRITLDPEPIRGLLLVHSDPPGVEVTMDSVSIGKTPTYVVECPLGKHTLRVNEAGYFDKEVNVNLDGSRPQKVTLELRRDSGTLDITSVPAGAEVYMEGASKGKTPILLENLASGKYEIRLEMEGYEPVKNTLYIRAGEQETVASTLKAIPGGLDIVTIPEDARVYVDDQFRGMSPEALRDLAPGEYRVKVEKPGFETDARSVEVINGQTNVQEFRLVKNTGILQIVTRPAGVEVFIGEKKVATTREGESDLQSQVLELDSISRGDHVILFKKDKHTSIRKEVSIEKDEITQLQVKLERPFVKDSVVIYTDGGRVITQEGMLIRRMRSGDLVLETHPGITLPVRARDVISVKPLRMDETTP